ncbi:general substrate transporter [Dichotomocladium elegans]|nr:general substrate transporter [Dichotomocladium elegans]
MDPPADSKIVPKTGWRVYLAVAFASIGGFLFGYDQGVMSGILVMPHWLTYFNYPDDVRRGFITSIYLLGAFAGAFYSGVISERIGRKMSIIMATLIFWLGTSMQAGASNDDLLLAGRFIQGMAIGQYSLNVTVYQSELSPAHLRGRAISLQQFSIVFGIMVAFWIGYGCAYINSDASWRVPLALQLAPSVLLFVGCFFLPYSPRWLASRGRHEECLQTLAKLHAGGDTNDPYVRQEYTEIMDQVKFDSEKGAKSYLEIFRDASTRRRVILAMGIQCMQQWIGINAVLYYAPYIFKSAGMTDDLSTLLATGVNGIVCVICTIPAVIFVDKWGRRNTLLCGGLGMALSMMIAGALLKVYPYVENGNNNTSAQYGAVAMMYIFSASFSFSWGPVGWIYPAEIFPTRARAKGASLATATNYLFNFVIGQITPVMIENIAYGTYMFFFATNIVCIGIVYFFYPETKNVSLEDMEVLFAGKDGQASEGKIKRMAPNATDESSYATDEKTAIEKMA